MPMEERVRRIELKLGLRPKGEGRRLTEVDVNTNNYCWVRLTELGRNIHRHRWEVMAASCPKLELKYDPPTQVAGWDRFQLWDLMQLYGRYMCNGGPQLFVDNVVRMQGEA